jgi:hypothetical protein
MSSACPNSENNGVELLLLTRADSCTPTAVPRRVAALHYFRLDAVIRAASGAVALIAGVRLRRRSRRR